MTYSHLLCASLKTGVTCRLIGSHEYEAWRTLTSTAWFAGAATATPYNFTCEVFGVPAGLYGASAAASPLFNARFSLFNALLVNVLNWGDNYMQTSWCGSGGLVATILAPNNEVSCVAHFESRMCTAARGHKHRRAELPQQVMHMPL